MTVVQHIALVGIKHSGKTSAGRILAREMGLPFDDTDALMLDLWTGSADPEQGVRSEADAGGIARVYRALGEHGFADLEFRVLQNLVEHPRRVIAAGGGLADRRGSLDLLGAHATLVYLAVDVSTAVKRVLERGVPAFIPGLKPAKELEALFSRRAKAYESASDLLVPTDGLSSADIARAIIRGLEASEHGR